MSHSGEASGKSHDIREGLSPSWPGKALGFPQELDEVTGERKVWTSLLRLLPT